MPISGRILWGEREQPRSAPVPGRSKPGWRWRERISRRLLTGSHCCARGRARSAFALSSALVVLRCTLFILAALLLGGTAALAADDIGDISVSAAAIYTGETLHGYAEARVVLENNSSKTHTVTLASPNHSYGSGNNVSRTARTVTLAPGVTVVVSLLQPPLPSNGDSLIRVTVDGREEGTTRLPNANNHGLYNRGGGTMGAIAFVSRSVDSEGMERRLNLHRAANAAAMAVGEPEYWARATPRAWMPDSSSVSQTNWLELDYARPVDAYHLEIHCTQSPVTSGFIELVGVSGTNITRLSLAMGVSSFAPRSGASHWIQEFSFPTTPEPVKTVRINFGTTAPSSIAIQAVALDDSHGQHYATSARASSENSIAAPVAPRARFGGGDPDAIQCLRAESALSDWSDNWLAYTPFDAVILGAGDLAAMPAPVATAIGDYVQAGGNVVIMGTDQPPAAWNPLASASKDPANDAGTEAGFGTVFAITAASPSEISPQTVRSLRETINNYAHYWSSLPYDSGAANGKLPVVESLKIPVRGITVIMLLFIVAVGPLNIFLLARKNRRIWMLWTIPAISLLTTLLVFVYSLVREGITPNTRIAGLTLLDQAGHHAETYGATGFYCPLTPSDGLRFDNETEATPLVAYGGYGPGAAREVDWTQTQHFQRGWVASRVPAQFHIRKSEVRRERLEWQKARDGWQIINGLGAPIKSLWLADHDMNFYKAENIPAGQPATLTPAKGPSTPLKQGPEALLRDRGYVIESMTDDDEAFTILQPGTYIAELDGNPFIENALGAAASPKRTHSASVVYGILDPPATP